jgi:hypothetical protein
VNVYRALEKKPRIHPLTTSTDAGEAVERGIYLTEVLRHKFRDVRPRGIRRCEQPHYIVWTIADVSTAWLSNNYCKLAATAVEHGLVHFLAMIVFEAMYSAFWLEKKSGARLLRMMGSMRQKPQSPHDKADEVEDHPVYCTAGSTPSQDLVENATADDLPHQSATTMRPTRYEQGRCSGTTRKELPCRIRVPLRHRYCVHHIGQTKEFQVIGCPLAMSQLDID